MTSTLFDGIGPLVTNDPEVGRGPLGIREEAALVVEDGRVAWAHADLQILDAPTHVCVAG